jgi:hypothetical protein
MNDETRSVASIQHLALLCDWNFVCIGSILLMSPLSHKSATTRTTAIPPPIAYEFDILISGYKEIMLRMVDIYGCLRPSR